MNSITNSEKVEWALAQMRDLHTRIQVANNTVAEYLMADSLPPANIIQELNTAIDDMRTMIGYVRQKSTPVA